MKENKKDVKHKQNTTVAGNKQLFTKFIDVVIDYT